VDVGRGGVERGLERDEERVVVLVVVVVVVEKMDNLAVEIESSMLFVSLTLSCV
jgi:hypothetical protein